MTEAGRPEFEVLWRQARKAVARGQVKLGYKAPDHAAARAVGDLIGRPLEAGVGTTIPVADLDERVRQTFHCGLSEVLTSVHGEAAVFNPAQPSVDAARREWTDQILVDALSRHGLADAPWAGRWIDHVRRYAKIAPERLAEPAARATEILARMSLRPGVVPTEWVARADLGGADLDRGRKVAGLVLRAAALAHGLDYPRTSADERKLWARCGVVPDSLSVTVLTTGLGLPLHATVRDLPARVEPGTVVSVCQSPRLVETALAAGVTRPLVCLTGGLSTVARQLLSGLAAGGAVVRCHADFDRTGFLLVSQVIALGGQPWRMSADDYRAALAADLDLPPLGAEPGATVWDPGLADALRAGWAVDEEMVIDSLMADLI